MSGYTNPFGGSAVQPADSAYRAVTLSANTTLVWPPQSQSATDYVARLMDVTATAANLTLTMPDATAVSAGFDLLLTNPGANTYTVANNAGTTICTVAPGQVQYLYLSDVSTAAGTWKVLQFGSLSSAVAAASLVGPGIQASGNALYAAESVRGISANTTVVTTDRTTMFVWTGGAGTLTLPLALTAGSDYFISVSNQGTGALTIACAGADTLDGSASQTFLIGESAVLHSGGATAWYTVGRGRSTQFNFTLLSKSVTSGTYTLTSIEASNTIQKYTGALTGNVTVVVPSTVQIYYVSNQTTNAFSLTFKTSAVGGSTITVPQGQNAVLACDGTNVINTATTVSGISSLTLSQGSAAAPSIAFSGDATTGLFAPGTGAFAGAAGGAEIYRVTSTGVGIKKTPTIELDVNGSAAVSANLSYSGTLTGGTGVVNLGPGQFYKDSSGNVGVGVTPSAWGGGHKAIELPALGAIAFSGTTADIVSNAYFNGTNWIYKNSGYSNYVACNSSGQFLWLTAPSGTAGAAITFTQVMTLGNSGNLTVVGDGAFAGLSASGTVSGAGFSNYLASPPAIGGTTPAAGSFTTLSASGTVSGAGFSNYLAAPPAIGGTTPNTGAFSTLSTTGAATIGKRAYTTAATVAFSATPTFDASASNYFIFGNLTANVTAVTVSNAQEGQLLTLRFRQDATGGRTVTLGNMGATNAPSISGAVNTVANKTSYLTLSYNATDARWDAIWTQMP